MTTLRAQAIIRVRRPVGTVSARIGRIRRDGRSLGRDAKP